MNALPSNATVWESGRLRPDASARRFEFGREQWIGSALLVVASIVFATYVAVLERDVSRSQLLHEAQAQGHCDAGAPPTLREACLRLANADPATRAAASADEAPPPNEAVAPQRVARLSEPRRSTDVGAGR